MKLKFPKTVTITSITFNVRKDNNSDGASLDLANREIKIGTKHLTTDPNYVFELICHELMEIVCILTSTRYDDYCVTEKYKFFMDHKKFQNNLSIFSIAINEFIV